MKSITETTLHGETVYRFSEREVGAPFSRHGLEHNQKLAEVIQHRRGNHGTVMDKVPTVTVVPPAVAAKIRLRVVIAGAVLKGT